MQVPNLCGPNPARAVFRLPQDSGGLQKSVGTIGIAPHQARICVIAPVSSFTDNYIGQ